MLEIKVNGTNIEVTTEGEAFTVVSEFNGAFFVLVKHIASLAAKEDKYVSKIEREMLASIVAVYITEKTGRDVDSDEGVDFAKMLTKILSNEIEMNILANMLESDEQEHPDGEQYGTE